VNTSKHVRMVKGSHIVVPRHYEGDQAYMFQNPDKRIVFAIPYEDAFTLLGTTEEPYDHDPHGVSIDEEETNYLRESVNKCFKQPVRPSDIVWSYAGVHPLYDDGSITYRRLSEHAMDEIMRHRSKRARADLSQAQLGRP
jgi:glycerol-3-phosphate dehydrogenase